MPHESYLPYLANGLAEVRQWDSRLLARGAQLIEYQPRPGSTFYRCIRGEWRDEAQSQGKHHILIDVLDEQSRRLTGIPLRLINGGEAITFTEAKPGEEAAANFPMFAAGWGYRIEVAYASDIVSRLGLGTLGDPMAGVHTGYFFVFQRTTQLDSTLPNPPTPPPTTPDPLLEALYMARQGIEEALRIHLKQTGG